MGVEVRMRVSVGIFDGRGGLAREKGVQSAGQDPLSPWGNTTVGQFTKCACEEHDCLSKDNQGYEQTCTVQVIPCQRQPSQNAIGTRTSDRIQR